MRRRRLDRRNQFAAAAAAIALTTTATRVAGAGSFEPYPSLDLAAAPADLVACVLLPLFAVAPFVGAAARLGVARA